MLIKVEAKVHAAQTHAKKMDVCKLEERVE